MENYIVVSGNYPYEFWGPFTESKADEWVKELKKQTFDMFAAKIRLKLPNEDKEYE